MFTQVDSLINAKGGKNVWGFDFCIIFLMSLRFLISNISIFDIFSKFCHGFTANDLLFAMKRQVSSDFVLSWLKMIIVKAIWIKSWEFIGLESLTGIHHSEKRKSGFVFDFYMIFVKRFLAKKQIIHREFRFFLHLVPTLICLRLFLRWIPVNII